jgi:transketolase-like protein
VRRHHPHAGNGCCTSSELRSPRNADGAGPRGLLLGQRILRFDPTHPIWPNRDRFVLSAGHASMLLYAMLHLTEVKAVNPKYETLGRLSVTLEDIKRFRQLGSKCPGHPEFRWTSGLSTLQRCSPPLPMCPCRSPSCLCAATLRAARSRRFDPYQAALKARYAAQARREEAC